MGVFVQQILMASFLLLVSSTALLSCSKQASETAREVRTGDSESMPIENIKLKNCRFSNSTPTYAFGSSIPSNPIQCDEGVPKKVEILTPAPLPSGVQFSAATLSISGTANERVVQAPYEFYLENESGYIVIKIQITIQ